jgi:hypothetical protein
LVFKQSSPFSEQSKYFRVIILAIDILWLFGQRDYHNMTKEPSERHFLFALTILSAQHQEVEQTQQLLRHIAFSGGYGTMTLTQGVTQGASENSGISYVPYNMGPSVGASLVPQSTNMGTSQSGTYGFTEIVLISCP